MGGPYRRRGTSAAPGTDRGEIASATQSEMGLRFGERLDLHTANSFRSWIRQDQRSDGRTRLQGIIPLQSLRTENLYQMLDDNPLQLDLLIVDEAHHCHNRETHHHRSARMLAMSSD